MRKILLLISGFVFLFSSVMVMKYRLELRSSAEYAENIAQMAVIPYPEQPVEQVIVKSAGVVSSHTVEETAVETIGGIQGGAAKEMAEKTPRVAPIQVDFKMLCEQNKDVVAWIYCPDTPINYPVVQSADNEYYMHRTLDGRKSYPGTLFVDFRNSDDFSDWNTVIYGHNMLNGSMFGTLQYYKQMPYFELHSEIYLLTPKRNYVINILAGFVTTDDSELYGALRPDDAEKQRLMEKWLETAGVALKNCPASDERLVTLSTCSYEFDNARYVLMGTLEELSD